MFHVSYFSITVDNVLLRHQRSGFGNDVKDVQDFVKDLEDILYTRQITSSGTIILWLVITERLVEILRKDSNHNRTGDHHDILSFKV